MEQEIALNAHNKQAYPPMHTEGFGSSITGAASINRLFLILMMLLLCVGVKAQESNVYVPKDLKDCIRVLDSLVPDTSKVQLASMDELQAVGACHFGLGLTIRNQWGLWSGSRLSEYWKKKGVFHPDDMSGIILRCYHRHLTGKPMRARKLIRNSRRSWRKEYGRGDVKKIEGGNSKSLKENAAFLNLPRIDGTTGACMDIPGERLTAQDSAYLQRHRGQFHGVAKVDTCVLKGNVKSFRSEYRRGNLRNIGYQEFDEQRRLTKCYWKIMRDGELDHYQDCFLYQYDSTGLLRIKTEYARPFEEEVQHFCYDYDSNGYTVATCYKVNYYHYEDGSGCWSTWNDDTLSGTPDSTGIEILDSDTVLIGENGRKIAELGCCSVQLYQYDSLGREVVCIYSLRSSDVMEASVALYDDVDGRVYQLERGINNVKVLYADKYGYVTRSCYQDFRGKRPSKFRRIRYDCHGNPKRIRNLRDGSVEKIHYIYY